MTPPETLSLDRFLGEIRAEEGVSRLILTIARGAERIASVLRRAGLAGALGSAGETNVQGEAVQKMDRISNQILVDAVREERTACRVASEEMEEPVSIREGAGYAVLFDPLDGSTNIDTGGTVGTIFSVRRADPRSGGGASDLLRPGTEQIAAGYVNYGPSTVLVLTVGEGSHLLTHDPGPGRFLVTQRGLRMPPRGKYYATNEGQRAFWHPPTLRLVEHLQTPDKTDRRPYSTRYSGCLVSDVHRILLEGGIYLYPADTRDPGKPSGKLRLMYECAPLALVVERAGGRASTGRGRILEVAPTSLHQRVPLFIGSAREVGLAEELESGRR
jgi:fructose-1,6-bisphosphatase I